MSLKVMIVDDMVIYRKILSDVVGRFDDMEVVGVASDGAMALKKLESTPVDMVLLDVFMPVMGGLETLKEIRKRFPHTHVIMISGAASKDAGIVLKALENGALDFIPKPGGNAFEENVLILEEAIGRIVKIVKLRQKKTGAGEPGAAPAPVSPAQVRDTAYAPVPKSFSILAVGVSTGGPAALKKIIPHIPANFPIPIVMVQHMPAIFTKSLAQMLDDISKVKVVEARDGEQLEKGKVLLAPGGKHLVLKKKNGKVLVKFYDGQPENGCKPAVDVLFRSVAECYGQQGIMALMLTGMGADGMEGVKVLKKKGCYCITQSEETCLIYGMPRAVYEIGLSDAQVDLESIATFVTDILNNASL